MAKKSLKKRIDDLVNALGRAKKPTFAEIRSELVALGAVAQELEDGQALSEKEAAIAALKAENENLMVELQAANTELDAFRAERKKQEEQEKKKELPEIQFRILKRLPSQHEGNWPKITTIARAAGIPIHEAEIHLSRLGAEGFVNELRDVLDVSMWYRTIKGSELVLAKRLAGEEEPAKQREYPKLHQMEEAILLAVANQEGMTAPEITEKILKGFPTMGKPIVNQGLVLLLLAKLREKNMVTNTVGRWSALPYGCEYLADRGL